MYSIIPFVLLAVNNCMLIYSIKFHKKVAIVPMSIQLRIRKRRLQMTITVFLITVLFILISLPGSFLAKFFGIKFIFNNSLKILGAIVSGFYFLSLSQTEVGSAIIILMDDISFSYHGFSFFTLLLTNKKFFSEFCVLLTRVGILKRRPSTKKLGAALSKLNTQF